MKTETRNPKPSFQIYSKPFPCSGLFLFAGLAIIGLSSGCSEGKSEYTTFEARRGPLDIKVLEGGDIEALESQEVKSEVRGWQGTKILFIVDEGYYVTDEDVENDLKLVELDSSEVQEKLTTAEITFKITQASYTEALKGHEIQLNKSEMDIYEAEVALKIARLDFEKFLGRGVSEDILNGIDEKEKVRLADEVRRAAEQALPVETQEQLDPVLSEPEFQNAVQAKDPVAPPIEVKPAQEESSESTNVEMSLSALRMDAPEIDFSQYANADLLGDGEANQKIRELEDKLQLAVQEEGLAKTEAEADRRLFENDFLTRIELENTEMDVERKRISVESAKVAKSLFIRYEFPKNSVQLMSDYIQNLRKLQRTEKQALSELVQADAKLLSAQARFKIEKERIEEYREQIGKHVMTAKAPGLVVYGGTGRNYYNDEPIKEGATIRERQSIITIPDLSTMAVTVKIHESEINKVKVDQTARVRIDAFSDRRLTGTVTKVAVLPDSQNRWMNPDLKVYETVIKVDGTHDWIKPGMNAETEIKVESLTDVVYIPIQSVVPDGRDEVCFVLVNGQPERRVIETDQTTVEFIVVTKGIEKGERVLIRPPEGSRNDETEGGDLDSDEEDSDETDSSEDAEETTTESDETDDESAESTDESPNDDATEAAPVATSSDTGA